MNFWKYENNIFQNHWELYINFKKKNEIRKNQKVFTKRNEEIVIKTCPKRNRRSFNNLNSNYHLISLVLNETFGSKLIKFGFVNFVKNWQWTKTSKRINGSQKRSWFFLAYLMLTKSFEYYIVSCLILPKNQQKIWK